MSEAIEHMEGLLLRLEGAQGQEETNVETQNEENEEMEKKEEKQNDDPKSPTPTALGQFEMRMQQAFAEFDSKVETIDKMLLEFDRGLKKIDQITQEKEKSSKAAAISSTTPILPKTQHIQQAMQQPTIPQLQLSEQIKNAMAYNFEVIKQLNINATPAIFQLQQSSQQDKLRELNETSYVAVKQLSIFVGSICESLVCSVLSNAHLAFQPKIPTAGLAMPGVSSKLATPTSTTSKPLAPIPTAGLAMPGVSSKLSTPTSTTSKPPAPPQNAPRKRGRPGMSTSEITLE